MKIISTIFIVLVALEHLYILWIEMFAWTTKGRTAFKSFPADLFERTKMLAANQGLYNGFLAAGLIWSLFIRDPQWHNNVALFFLSCVVVAGLYGALTADRSILFKQALPAIIGMSATIIAAQ